MGPRAKLRGVFSKKFGFVAHDTHLAASQVNVRDEARRTALLWAARHGAFDAVTTPGEHSEATIVASTRALFSVACRLFAVPWLFLNDFRVPLSRRLCMLVC